tara:strand:+ start:2213 stop:2707 length:495 start_codon:yes stop_codon:yes gene_type:complete
MKGRKFIFLLIGFLLLGCSKNSSSNFEVIKPNLYQVEIQSHEENHKDVVEENLSKNEFNTLYSLEEIKNDVDIGKTDPFAKSNDLNNLELYKDIILRGIISDGKRNYALIDFKENSGTVEEGDIGGESTNLLPENVKVFEINLTKNVLILEAKNNKLDIYFPKK